MISEETIKKVNESVRIEDIASQFLQLKKAGANLKGCCPFHSEKTPSFVINPARNIFKCFGCGKGGDAITFLKEQGKTFTEAIKYIAVYYNIEVEEERKKHDVTHDARVEIRATLAAVQAHFTETKNENNPGRKYWIDRGFTPETLDTFGVGWCESISVPHVEPVSLISAGIANIDTGNISVYKRATIPIHDRLGNIVSFAGRLVETKEDSPKYINGRETPAYNKKGILYNLHRAATEIRKTGEIWLVEGYADVWALYQTGVQNTIAVSGTALTDEHINELKKFNGEKNLRVYLAFDNEINPKEPGYKKQVQKAMFEALTRLLTISEVRLLEYPKGCKDMADVVTAKKFDLATMKATSKDAIEQYINFTWNKSASPVEKAEYQETAAGLIARIKKDSVRDIYIKNIAEKLECTLKKFDELVKKAVGREESEINNRRLDEHKHIKVLDEYLERQPQLDPATGAISYRYVKRKKEEIKDEYGPSYLRNIPRFTNYILAPSHVEYKRVVEVYDKTQGTGYKFFNRYEPLPYTPKTFDIPAEFYSDRENYDYEKIPEIENTAQFFKHIFDFEHNGNRFVTLGWDYFALLYLHPEQRLPALSLVSQEEGTGKSTLINYFLKFFADNATKAEVGRIGGKFNALFSGKVLACVEETKDEKGNIENMLKDLITSFDRVIERKGVDAYVEASYEKYVFASNHEDSFMKVGTQTTRFFVMKVYQIKKKVVDFEQKLYHEIPYVMHFLQKRGVITPKRDRLWFHPDDLLNEALVKLRQASKDIIQQNMEELIQLIFLRTEVEIPVLKFSSEYVAKLMRAYAGRMYEQKTPNYFAKVCQIDMRLVYRSNPSKFVTTIIKPVESGADLAALSTWEYENRQVSGRAILFPIWRFLDPVTFVDNYEPTRAKNLIAGIKKEISKLEIDYFDEPKKFIKQVEELNNSLKNSTQIPF